MTRDDKIQWMATWAAKHGVQLVLEGECGFGRECVGVSVDGGYLDYEWYDDESFKRADKNGDVWCPPNAYHKHPCVAVLGRGEAAEAELYDWLKWFDENNFVVETGNQAVDPRIGALAILLGKHRYKRMVRENSEDKALREANGG